MKIFRIFGGFEDSEGSEGCVNFADVRLFEVFEDLTFRV